MKTRKQRAAKLPKGRTAWALDNQMFAPTKAHFSSNSTRCLHAVAFLPAATKAHAKQMVKAHKFLAMTREEQVEALRLALIPVRDYNETAQAEAVLAALYSEAKP
jgi:hypothetical protein